MPELVPGALRRQRMIERSGEQIWAMFRDSYARPGEGTGVLHEYTVQATLEPVDDPSGPGAARYCHLCGHPAGPAVGRVPRRG